MVENELNKVHRRIVQKDEGETGDVRQRVCRRCH